MTSISNFGQTGPYRDYKATELELEAMSGSLYLIGNRDKPIKAGGFQAQYATGLIAFISICTAILNKPGADKEQHLDVSIMDCFSILDTFQATAPYTYMGVASRRKFYARFVTGHPVGIYPCKDGYVIVLPGLGGMMSLALLLGKPELAEHPYFVKPWARQEHAEEFDATFLHPWLKEHGKEEIVDDAQSLRMPFGSLETIDELFREPQLVDREYFDSIDHPVAGRLKYPGAPFKTKNETMWVSGRAPLLGENNEEILCEELGYTRETLEKFRESNVI